MEAEYVVSSWFRRWHNFRGILQGLLFSILPGQSSTYEKSLTKHGFYNEKLWQEVLEVQAVNREESEAKPGQMMNFFPNAAEVKIFERVEHYHEHPPDANP